MYLLFRLLACLVNKLWKQTWLCAYYIILEPLQHVCIFRTCRGNTTQTHWTGAVSQCVPSPVMLL